MQNVDTKVVEGFGREWAAFDQISLDEAEHDDLFGSYFGIFPFDELPENAEGFDLGCGSGRWAAKVAPRVGLLHCVDPAAEALEVARRRLAGMPNVRFHLATSDAIPLSDDSQDFGYSLGVLHHIPDTEAAMLDCVRKLKPGAPFLVYLYYRFDNKPRWFSALWRATDLVRGGIARLPFGLRKLTSDVIAATVYWPLARSAGIAERIGVDVSNVPLSPYRRLSFYTMRTDALDRFGTRLEQRFTRGEIAAMMTRCGLKDVRFHDGVPYWVACGIKA
jgi:SAM-dependent methyltransferase